LYLKEVKMENFKSVKGQVSVKLTPGFTGITGPNGSGKSNITDAILFVIGPKSSKAIRAGNLLDLIWNGGEGGKPADKCKVTLVLDNSDKTIPVDYEEIHLTRVIKRSKENKIGYSSYFYINGNKSTLREFEELLSYAGISSDGYNIVQQGDVTAIVKMGAVERRRILESIAGITHLDSEMEKARNKRVELEANQEKIEVLMEELRTRITELERDRKSALRYRELSERMKRAQAQLAYRKLKNAKADLESKEKAIESFRKEIGDSKAEMKNLVKKVAEIKLEIERTDDEMASRWGDEGKKIKEQIDAFRLSIARAEQSMERAEDNINDYRRLIDAENSRLKDEMEELEELRERKASLESEKDDVIVRLSALEKENGSLKAEFSKSSTRGKRLREDASRLRKKNEEHSAELSKARQELAKKEERIRALKERKAELEERKKKAEFEVSDAKWQMKELRKGGEFSPAQIRKMKQEAFQLRVEEREVSTELQRLQKELSRLAEKHAETKAKLGNSGNTAVNAILDARDRGVLKGIIGSVSELMDYDEKYSTAIEVAAGARMNAVIVENDEAGANAIRYLKSNKLGRATFLPLNKMKAGRPRGTALMAARKDGAIDFAIEIARYDERHRSAMWYVFGDTLVVKDLDTARRLMGGVRLVTPGGEMIEAGGAMVGGNLSSKKGNTRRLRELEELGRALREKREKEERLSARLAEIRPRLEELDEYLNKADADAETLAKIESYTMKLKEAEKRSGELSEMITGIKNEIDTLESEISVLNDTVSELDRTVSEQAKKIEGMENEMESLMPEEMQKRMGELESEIEELRRRKSALLADISSLNAQINALEKSMAERKQRILEAETRIKEAEELRKSKNEERSKAKNELDALLTMNKGMEAEMEALRKKRDELVEEKSEMVSRINRLRDAVNGKEDYILSMRAQIEAIRTSMDEAEEEFASYGIEVADPVPAMDTLRKTIRSCELEMSGIGPVNFRAIEDYDAQSARYSEMEREVRRIEEQKSELLKVEEELEQKKKDGFFRIFSAVNENFKRVYSEMSGGGEGYLELENGDSPFEGGMNIVAKPRGKKVTRIEALSGGEKGLVALSFIFAIQEYDPSAFYIFDEADQNLDTINSEIMARRIKISSSRAQFLMVSLRKAALQYADHLIGVTSLGDGITRIVQQMNIEDVVEPDAPEEEAAEVSA